VKELSTLIRLHRNLVDEHRHRVSQLQNRAEELAAARRRLDEEFEAERQAAAGSVEAGMTFLAFVKVMQRRQAQADHAIAHIRAEIMRAEADLAAAFQDLKKFELAQEERERQIKEERRRRENQMFDEVAATRHRRAQQEMDG